MAVTLQVAGVGKDFLIPVIDAVSFAVEAVSAAKASRIANTMRFIVMHLLSLPVETPEQRPRVR